MICKHCNTENSNDAQFCRSCGSSLAWQDESIKSNKRVCLHKLFIILLIGTAVCFSYSCLSYFCYSSYKSTTEGLFSKETIYYCKVYDPLNIFSQSESSRNSSCEAKDKAYYSYKFNNSERTATLWISGVMCVGLGFLVRKTRVQK